MNSYRHQPSIQASYEPAIARPSYGHGCSRTYAELAAGQQLKPSADYPLPITLAADATTLNSVHRSLRTKNWFETFTLFSRVTLIRKLQSTSDLDHFHPRGLPCSHVKSRDDPISGRRGDSGVLFSFIYKDMLHSKVLELERSQTAEVPFRINQGHSYWHHSVDYLFSILYRDTATYLWKRKGIVWSWTCLR